MWRDNNNVSVLIEVAINCFITQTRWHICCEDGTAIVQDWSCNGKIVKLNNNEDLVWEDIIVYTEAEPTRTMALRPVETTDETPLHSVESK